MDLIHSDSDNSLKLIIRHYLDTIDLVKSVDQKAAELRQKLLLASDPTTYMQLELDYYLLVPEYKQLDYLCKDILNTIKIYMNAKSSNIIAELIRIQPRSLINPLFPMTEMSDKE